MAEELLLSLAVMNMQN